MCDYCHHPAAEPLTAEQVKELVDEGAAELVVSIGGLAYCSEDLYSCQGCGEKMPDYHELDDDGLCEGCAEEAKEYEEYRKDVEWEWRHSRL